MSRVPKQKKSEQLLELNELVQAACEKFASAPGDHQVVAILGLFLGVFERDGIISPEMIQEAWEELYEIGKVIRDEFCLMPVPAHNTWVVLPMVGINGPDEE